MNNGRMIPASALEAEKVKFERRSQKVLGILGKKDQRINELESLLRGNELINRNDQLVSENEMLREKVKDMAEQVEVLVGEISSLRGLASEKQKDTRLDTEKVREQLISTELERDEIRVNWNSAKLKADKLQTENRGYNEKFAILEFQLKGKIEGLEKGTERIRVLESILSTAKETILKREKELSQAKLKISSLLNTTEHPSEQKARQLELQVKQLSNDLSHSTLEFENMANAYKEQCKQQLAIKKTVIPRIPSTNKDKGALEEILLQQSNEIVTLRSLIVQLNSQQQHAQQNSSFEKKKLVHKIRELEQKLRQAGENGEMIRKQLATTVRVLSGKSNLHMELGKVGDQVGSLHVKNAELNIKLKLCRAEFEESEERCRSLHQSCSKLELELDQFRKSDVYHGLGDLAHEVMLRRLAKELEECKDMLAKKSKIENVPFKFTSDESDETQTVLSQDEVVLMNENQKVRWMSNVQFTLKRYEEEVKVSNLENDRMVSRLNELQEQYSLLESKHAEETLESEKQHSEQLSVLNGRIVDQAKEIQVMMDAKHDVCREYELTRAQCLELSSQLKSVKDTMRSKCVTLNTKVEELQDAKKSLETKLSIADISSSENKTKVSILEEALDAVQQQYVSSPTTQHEMIATLTNKFCVMESENSDLKRKCTRLEHNVDSLRKQFSITESLQQKQEKERDEFAFLLQEETTRVKMLEDQVLLLERQLEENKELLSQTHLKLIDAQSFNAKAVLERDNLLSMLSCCKEQFLKDLGDEQKSFSESLRSFEIFARDDQHGSHWNLNYNSMKEELEIILKQISDVYSEFQNSCGLDDEFADPGIVSFGKLTELFFENEHSKVTLESKVRCLEWERHSLREKISKLQERVHSSSMKEAKALNQLRQFERSKQVELSLKSLYFESRLSGEKKRVESLEHLLLRSNGLLKVRYNQDNNPQDAELVVILNAAQERNIRLETEVKESVLRLEEFKLFNDGADEKRKVFMENEKKIMERSKYEISGLREQLTCLKREIVELTFDYETRLINDVKGDGPLLPSEMHQTIIEQTKEMSDLQSKLVNEQEKVVRLQVLIEEKERYIEDSFHDSVRDVENQTNQTQTVLLEQKDAQIHRLRAEADVISRRLEESTQANQSLSHANGKVVEALEKFQTYFDRKKRNLDSTKTSVNETSIVLKLSEKLDGLLEAMQGDELEGTVVSFQLILDRYNVQGSDITALKQALAEKENRMKQLENDFQRQRHEALDQAKVSEAGLRVAHSKISHLMQQCQKNQDFNSKIQLMTQQIECLETEREESSSRQRQCEEHIKELQYVIDEETSKKDDLIHQMELLNMNTREKEIQIELQEDELLDLRERNSDLAARLGEDLTSTEHESLSRLQSALKQLRTKDNDNIQKIKLLEKRLSSGSGTVDRLKTQLEEVKHSWTSPEETKKLRKYISESKTEIKRIKSHATNRVKSLQEELGKNEPEKPDVENLKKKLSNLETRLKSMEMEMGRKDNVIANNKNLLETAKTQLHESQEKSIQLETQIETLTREKKSFRNKITTLQTHVQQLKSEVVTPPVPEPRVEPTISSQVHAKLERLTRKVSVFENQLKDKDEHIATLEDEKTVLEKDKSKFNGRLKSLERERDSISEGVATLDQLAKQNREETVVAEQALLTALLRIAEETLLIKEHMYERQTNNPQGTSMPINLDFSDQDFKDIMGADARINDPAFKVSMDKLTTIVTRHKSWISHLFNTRGSLPTHLSSPEFQKLVDLTCSLWRQ